MSASVKFNDRNHVETTVLPTYHFQNALPALVSFSIDNYDLATVALWYNMGHIENLNKLYRKLKTLASFIMNH